MTTPSPCAHCNAPNPSVYKKSGRVGITRTAFYRETIKCGECRIEVTAGTPGNAVKFWNRAYEGRKK